MADESVLFSADVEPRTARLLFIPSKVISVKAADDSVTYEEGRDYTIELKTGILRLTDNSRIPCPKLYDGEGENYGRFKTPKGQRMLFSEGSFFHKLQIKVAYEHSGNSWDGKDFLPVPQPQKFPRLHTALSNKACTVALLGDSISVGYNASGFVKASPGQSAFGSLTAERLRKSYEADVKFVNVSRAGGTTSYGLANVSKIAAENPDLVIIAFGMNDGFRPGNDQKYEDNMRRIIDTLRKNNPDVEIVLVANMLPNNVFSYKGHFANRQRLLDLEKKYRNVAVADVMSVTQEMLKRKKFADICGNHINHPNDFIHRLYAEVILRVIGAN